ncbi:hypothetical protein [Streptomyces sp. NPDC005407]|uniref:hypothetical protein n=1 Tax=Streptomyces sp. NPDC005407 TaxID=3155340 RepID=UPI0033A2CA37
MPGWEGQTHPHTGEGTGSRPESPGYTEEQRANVERLRTQCRELSITVAAHPHWAQVETGEVVEERMRLKHVTRPAEQPLAVAA